MSREMYEMKEYLYFKYGQRCEVCGEEFPKKELTGHHIIERCRGGLVSEENILIACKECHFKKINKLKYGSYEYWELMEKSLEHRMVGK